MLLAAMACCALLIGYQLVVTLLQPAWLGPATYWLRVALAWLGLLLVVYVGWRVSHTRRAAAVTFWMLSAAMFTCAIGRTLWTVEYQFIYPNGVPFPGLPDLFFLLQYPFFFLAMIAVPHRSWSLHLVAVLDGLLLMGAAAALSWQFLLTPLLVDSGLPPLSKALSLAYPAGDLFVLFGLVTIYVHPLRYTLYVVYRPALLVLLLAFACLILGDSWAVVLLARPGHIYRTGDVPNLLRFTCYLLIPLAALVRLRLDQYAARQGWDVATTDLLAQQIPKQDIGKSLHLFLPILTALLASAVITVHALLTEESAGWRGLLAPLTVGFSLLLLVIVRQGVMFLEIARLQRATAVARANEQAQRELNRRKDEFLGVLSHEIRTPLTSLQGYVHLAARRLSAWQPPTPAATDGTDGTAADASDLLTVVTQTVARAQSSVAACDEGLQRLTRLADDLVDDTRIREGQLALHRAPCDLCMLVRSAVAAQRALEPERVIVLRTGRTVRTGSTPSADAEAPLLVDADADRIGQVITNYLSNALKYSRADRPVEVAVEALLLSVQGQGETVGHASFARVAVRDVGPGLAEEEQAQVWERYPRLEGVRVQSGSGVSLGLGLHISKTIIERHGGEVGVESAPGQGSTFWFILPLITCTTLAPPAAGST